MFDHDTKLKKGNTDWYFILSIIVLSLVIVLVVLGISPAFGESSFKQGVTILEVKNVAPDSFRVLLDYCQGIKTQNSIGVVLFSTIESVPIPINSEQKAGDCSRYGSIIHAKTTQKIKSYLISMEDLDSLLDELEIARSNLQKKLVSLQQELIEEGKSEFSNTEVISHLNQEITQIENLLKSNLVSIKTVISMY